MQNTDRFVNATQIGRMAYKEAVATGEMPSIVEHHGNNVPVRETLGVIGFESLLKLAAARRGK